MGEAWGEGGCKKGETEKMQTRFRNALLNGTLLERSRQMRSDPTDAERKLWAMLRRDGLGVKFKKAIRRPQSYCGFLLSSAKADHRA